MITDEKLASETVREDVKEYGLYTLTNRALPDVRDGLKPVQRLLMWSLWELKKTSKSIPAKCAKVAAHTTGNYHPHGPEACYGALVNLNWLRYPLVKGEGNFGSKSTLDDDGYAAARYTEVKMSEMAERLFDDIAVGEYEKNYSEEYDQPVVLPSRIPLLAINGSEGIAVGLRSSIPPHNLGEILDACEFILENDDYEVADLLKFIKGPDYGSGILTSKKKDLLELYSTGKGKLTFCCNYEIEKVKKNLNHLVVTGFAPGFNKKRFLQETITLYEQKLLLGAANDEGDLESGTRIVVPFKDVAPVKDRLISLLNTSVSYQMYALDEEGVPTLFTLGGLLENWLEFRKEVEQARLEKEYDDIIKKLGTERAKFAAIRYIDKVVEIIKKARSVSAATKRLMSLLEIKEWQAEVILNSSLRSLMRLNASDIQEKITSLKKGATHNRRERKNITGVVDKSLGTLKKYDNKRGTRLRVSTKKEEQAYEEIGEATYYVGVTEKGKIESFSSAPVKSKATWPYVGFTETDGSVIVVKDDNSAQVVSVSYLDKYDESGGAAVGLAKFSEVEWAGVLVMTKTGKWCCFSAAPKKTKFNVLKNFSEDEELVYVRGVDSQDTVFIILSDGTVKTLEELSPTRPNVKAKRLLRKGDSATVKRVVVKGPDDSIVNVNTGDEVSSSATKISSLSLYAVGQENLVVLKKANKRILADMEGVLQLVKAKEKIVEIVKLR